MLGLHGSRPAQLSDPMCEGTGELMAVTWERLAGDTSRFAVKLSFSDDPDAGHAATPEESLSWGSFQFWVHERNLSAHYFQGELIESVHWYLLPLLEWLTSNWDPIFHEERLPNQNAAPTAEDTLQRTLEPPRSLPEDDAALWERAWFMWWNRHSIEAARFGGVFPSICLRRWRDEIEISWDPAFAPQRPSALQFLQVFGAMRLPIDDVATPLFDVLHEAIQYLLTRSSDSQRLRTLASSVSALKTVSDDRFAWLLGLGHSLSDMKESLKALRDLADTMSSTACRLLFGATEIATLYVPPFPAALMFGAVSPEISAPDRVQLLQSLVHAMDESEYPIDRIASSAPVDIMRSWEQGYRFAEEFLDRFDDQADPDQPTNLDDLLVELGVTVGSIPLDDEQIRGVSIAGPQYRPTILLNQRNPRNRHDYGRRFSIAHELCHLLFDRAFAREVALASGPWAPRDIERRANAFAAMLLMPSDRLARVIASSPHKLGSRELVADIAARLRTGFTATVEHLCNLAFISDDERDALLEDPARQDVA
jgi:hypothetical protein